MEMKGSRVLVTGGARRVGRSIVLCLLNAGCSVAVHYHTSRKAAQELKQETDRLFPDRTLLVQGDVTRKADWERMRNQIEMDWNGLDVLVHNAAVFGTSDVLSTDEAEWNRFMDINLKSVLLGTQVFAPDMKRRSGGKIIAIADVAGELIWPSYIPYAVSKAGVLALMRGLAQSLAPEIQVNAVSPGPVLAPEDWSKGKEQQVADELPLKRFGSPEDIAQAVCYLIASGDFITGHNLRVDGGRMVRR